MTIHQREVIGLISAEPRLLMVVPFMFCYEREVVQCMGQGHPPSSGRRRLSLRCFGGFFKIALRFPAACVLGCAAASHFASFVEIGFSGQCNEHERYGDQCAAFGLRNCRSSLHSVHARSPTKRAADDFRCRNLRLESHRFEQVYISGLVRQDISTPGGRWW